MKLKSVRIFLIATLVLASLATAVNAASQLLADADDNFEVTTPIPNAVVQGTISTVFKVYDDDQTDVPYQISLLDASQCSTQQALVARGDATSTKTDSNSVSWSTYGPTVDQTLVADGAYCQLVCVSLKNSTLPYTACNARIINVRNDNHAPKITSSVPNDLSITTSDNWEYTVLATDADSNSLTFRLSSNPNFLEIDSNSGVISTNSNTKVAGTYAVTVVVDDGKGGTATQSWNLIVQSGSGSGSSSSSSQTDAVTIAAPTATSEFSDTDNKITWTAHDAQGIDGFTINYATFPDLADFIEIAEVDSTATSYTWDVTGIASGTYSIQIVMTDKVGNQVSDVSQEFQINNGDNTGNNSSPLIIALSPADKTTITEPKPEISGQFSPPADGTIDSSTFTFKLDDVDATADCSVDSDGFICVPTVDLAKSSHKAEASVFDSLSHQTSVEWTFTVADASVTTPSGDNTTSSLSIGTIALGVVGVIILILLFVIPWILYVRWRKQQQTKTTQTVTSVTSSPVEPLPTLPSSPAASAVVVPSPEPEPTPVSTTTNVAPDPLNYPSYQDYLNAVAEGTAGLITPNKSEVVEPTPLPELPEVAIPEVVEPESQVIAPVVEPEPVAQFTEMPESTLTVGTQSQMVREATPTPEPVVTPPTEPLQSASGLPDWLKPVETADSITTPLPAAPVEPAVIPSQSVPAPVSELPVAPTQAPEPSATAAPEDMLAEHSLPPLPEDSSASLPTSGLTETGIAEKQE